MIDPDDYARKAEIYARTCLVLAVIAFWLSVLSFFI